MHLLFIVRRIYLDLYISLQQVLGVLFVCFVFFHVFSFTLIFRTNLVCTMRLYSYEIIFCFHFLLQLGNVCSLYPTVLLNFSMPLIHTYFFISCTNLFQCTYEFFFIMIIIIMVWLDFCLWLLMQSYKTGACGSLSRVKMEVGQCSDEFSSY